MRPPLFFPIVALLLTPLVSIAAGLSVVIDGRAVMFSDVPEDAWFATYVRQAAEAGIVSGYRDAAGNLTGKFGPGDPVTIAQALKIAVEGAGYDPEPYVQLYGSNLNYADHWVAPYLAVALQEMGAIEYVNQNQRNVDRIATRIEVVSMIAGAFKIDTNFDIPSKSPYSDVDVVHPNILAVVALTRDGVISGDTDIDNNPIGRFRPSDFINRAEALKIVLKARMTYGKVGSETGKGRLGMQPMPTISYREPPTQGRPPQFSPSELRVKSGTRVQFRNDRVDSPMWIASNPHPIHNNLPGFDAGRAYHLAEIYSFVFTRPGTFEYHDHLNPRATGTIIVE